MNYQGLTSHVLELDWKSKDMSKAFETNARLLRYQALGRACTERHIGTLLLGHHQDDNVETAIWRLASGSRGAGLAGMAEIAPIPDCHGLYGVSESGSTYQLQRSEKGLTSPRIWIYASKGEIERLPSYPPLTPALEPYIATGGIVICRPLLPLRKANLISTCKANGVPFVSDPTNNDPTLTPRNAIRGLIHSGALPKAIQPESMLQRMKRAQEGIANTSILADKLLGMCEVLDLNLRGGWLLVKFPDADARAEFLNLILSTFGKDKSQEFLDKEAQKVMSLALRRLSSIVSGSPGNYAPLKSFALYTDRIFFQDLKDPWERQGGQQQQPQQQGMGHKHQPRKPFTVNRTILSPYTWRVPKSTTTTANKTTDPFTQDSNNNIWLLSRQPYFRNQLSIHHFDVPIPSPSSPSDIDIQSLTYTPWHLWDNRFWVRLALEPAPVSVDQDADTDIQPHIPNPSSRIQKEKEPLTIKLTLKPLTPSDMPRIKSRLERTGLSFPSSPSSYSTPSSTSTSTPSAQIQTLKSILDRESPGVTRFTIPILVMQKRDPVLEVNGEVDKEEEKGYEPLALPTMDIRLSSSLEPGFDFQLGEKTKRWKVRWEWLYREVDKEIGLSG